MGIAAILFFQFSHFSRDAATTTHESCLTMFSLVSYVLCIIAMRMPTAAPFEQMSDTHHFTGHWAQFLDSVSLKEARGSNFSDTEAAVNAVAESMLPVNVAKAISTQDSAFSIWYKSTI